MPDMTQIALITGSSKGIGKEIALALSENGYKVYASMRTPGNCQFASETLIPIELDVTNKESISSAVQQIIENEGHIDILINNAGFGLYAPVDLATEEEIHHQFDVNVYGAIRVIQEVVPYMRKQRSGKIINMSSIAGIISNPFMGIYSATKHAIEAISESLAYSLSAWNIHVSVVEPGAVATHFSDSMREGSKLTPDNPYEPFSSQFRTRLDRRLSEGQNPKEIGELLVKICEETEPSFRYQTSERIRNMASQFLQDVSGDERIANFKDEYAEYLDALNP